MAGETARLSGEQDGGAPPRLPESRGGARAAGCPNSSGSVHLPVHPPALILAPGRARCWEREGLAAVPRKDARKRGGRG